jgi:hypothetical protein
VSDVELLARVWEQIRATDKLQMDYEAPGLRQSVEERLRIHRMFEGSTMPSVTEASNHG